MEAADAECKVVLVGDSRCGKTSLVQRFVSDQFAEVYTPTGFEKYTCTGCVGGHRVRFVVWDTSGAAAYDSVRPLAYPDARVFLLCFRIGDPDSLENAVRKWYGEVRQHSPGAPLILCGCAADQRGDVDTLARLARRRRAPVSSEQALQVSRQLGAATYVETSSRTAGRAVRDAFEVAALAALGKLNSAPAVGAPNGATNGTNNGTSGGANGGGGTNGGAKAPHPLKAELKGRARSCCVM
ncbi:hypothetical protein R5R35_005484 [Gryllus longicercus]|uniref:Uncharacterized protein n=1 Tax=Gryllus longicercus TaxID=2509291 RepID=A0AAN9VZ73_9ORTH